MMREAAMRNAARAGAATLDADYVARFGGIARLFGNAAVERLHAAHVCVVGIGGVGSWVVEALARTGIGALTLVDADDVCVTNVNRQLLALTDTVGCPKVGVMAGRVRQISPSCRIEACAEFYTKKNASELLAPRFDFVVDCVDRMSIKAHLIHECHARGLRVLTCGSAGGRRDPSQIRAGDLGRAGNDELLRQVRRQLRREHGWPEGRGGNALPMGVPCVFTGEKPVYPRADGTCGAEPEKGESLRMDCASGVGAATFITGTFGFVAASEVVRLLLSGDHVPQRAD
jgi:tRNA A37 threonylcarbamoyladenosine dehydratase